MEAIFYIFAKVISLALSALGLAMFVRVVMQIVGQVSSYDVQGNKFFIFCYTVTEIYVTPFRFLCSKFNLFTGTPIDMPFFLAYITLVVLNSFLPII